VDLSIGGKASNPATIAVTCRPPLVTTAVLYAANSLFGVFKRAEGDAGWSSVNTGSAALYILAGPLAIDPSNPATVYLGAADGVYKTTNGGGAWTPAKSGMAGTVTALVIDPTNTATLYAGTSGHGIFKSTNGGAAWAPVNAGLSPILEAQQDVVTLAVDPRNPVVVYAGSDGSGVYKSANGGATWTPVNSGIKPSLGAIWAVAVAVDPSNSLNVFVGTQGSGVFKSTDAGATWNPANTGLGSGQIAMSALVLDPANPLTVYAGGGYEIWKSTNGGTSWGSTGFYRYVGRDVAALVIDPGRAIYAGAGGGVYVSTDGGATWAAFSAGLPAFDIAGLASARACLAVP
jgi:photosystem II stability/assembly factor-like uncharacterized protein